MTSDQEDHFYFAASQFIIFVEKLFADTFEEFERKFNCLISQRKLYFERILCRLYRNGLFNNNVYNTMEISFKEETVAQQKSAMWYRYTVQIILEEIANAIRRSNSMIEAENIGKNIAKVRFRKMQKFITKIFRIIKQERKNLKTKLENIIDRNNKKPVTKSSECMKAKRNKVKVNRNGCCHHKIFARPTSENISRAANLFMDNLKMKTNRRIISFIHKLNWKSRKQKDIYENFLHHFKNDQSRNNFKSASRLTINNSQLSEINYIANKRIKSVSNTFHD